MVPGISIFGKKVDIWSPCFRSESFWKRPCFSLNHSKYCTVGTYCFAKRHFFITFRYISCFYCFPLCLFLQRFFSIDFNKTPIIAQPLSPPFFGKKRVIFQKTHSFQLFIFASSFFRFFCFFMLFLVCFKKHLFHPTVGPLGLSLRPNLATARASEGQSPACFPCFWRFSLFQFVRLFSVLPSIPLGPKWHPKATVCSPMAASRPQNANKRYKDDTTNDETTKTTKRRTRKRQHNAALR
jgi:hypothetical protein